MDTPVRKSSIPEGMAGNLEFIPDDRPYPPLVGSTRCDWAMEAWWAEIDRAGIDAVVVAGRYMEGQPEMSIGGEALKKMEEQYPGRFYGITPVNLDQDMKKSLAELEADLALGMRGATTVNNPELYPVYEIMQDAALPRCRPGPLPESITGTNPTRSGAWTQ